MWWGEGLVTLEWRSKTLVEVEFGKSCDLFAKMKIIRWVWFNSVNSDWLSFTRSIIFWFIVYAGKHANTKTYINSRTRARTHTIRSSLHGWRSLVICFFGVGGVENGEETTLCKTLAFPCRVHKSHKTSPITAGRQVCTAWLPPSSWLGAGTI